MSHRYKGMERIGCERIKLVSLPIQQAGDEVGALTGPPSGLRCPTPLVSRGEVRDVLVDSPRKVAIGSGRDDCQSVFGVCGLVPFVEKPVEADGGDGDDLPASRSRRP